MDRMTNSDQVKTQYSNGDNLSIRISIHNKYSKNKQGFGNWINEQYEIRNGYRILELGCGNGDMWSGHIAHIGEDSELVLSDFSDGMVEEVRKKYQNYPNVSFQQINIEEIPYEDQSFDVVIANMMLYHVPNLEKALSEIARVLKKDGVFYAATFGENGIHRYITTSINEVEKDQKIEYNTFTLQNGYSILSKRFSHVLKKEYIDSLEVTNTNDLIEYIYSMATIIDDVLTSKEELYELFEKKKDEHGVIRIPKEYGMFISRR